MRFSALFLFLVVLFGLQTGEAETVIEGKVELPKPTSSHHFNQRYAAGGDAPVVATNPPAAVVYLEGKFAPIAQKSPATMEQKNIAFAPDLLPVLIGTLVEFPNRDDTYHNVFSYSKAKRFDLGRFRKEEKPAPVVFDKPGPVSVHCEIHENMRGTILVLESPYFKKTDHEGRYRLENLPEGRFVLKAWVSAKDVREQPVEIRNGTVRVDFPAK